MPKSNLQFALSRVAIIIAVMVGGASAFCFASIVPERPLKQDKAERRRLKALQKEMASPYKKWIEEEVPFIITEGEKAAFRDLSTDDERESFVELFWENRNPNPGSPENEFKEEYYRRVAYANEHYASGVPGWRTDRGRIYIMYGPPDEIDAHSSGGTYNRPPEEGGGSTNTYPFEKWRYRHIDGIGENIVLEFVDTTMTGEFHLSIDPGEKDALAHVPGVGLTQFEAMNMASKADRFSNTDLTTLGTTMGMQEDEFSRLERYYKIFKAPEIAYKNLRANVSARLSGQPLAFELREDFIRVTEESVMMPVTLQVANRDLTFVEKDGLMHAGMDIFGQITNLVGRPISSFEDSVALDVPEDEFLHVADRSSAYQKSLPLQPGLYKLTVVIKDHESGRIGSIELGTKVPRFLDDELSNSTLILADVVQPLPSRQVGSGPFVIGGMKVRPSVTRVFTRDESLNIYLQVYNLGIDQDTHRTSTEIHYDVAKDGKVIISKAATQSQGDEERPQITLADSLPLKSLGPGTYTLTIRITDNVRKQTVAPRETFQLR
ncbi:MAG TPA: GWxTD domain-containing protein [Terriglobia bacterium]|nr:GWxTD domain-containing protein [Terriglobia bacterium]